jgi:AraC-like DNA-binding protein
MLTWNERWYNGYRIGYGVKEMIRQRNVKSSASSIVDLIWYVNKPKVETLKKRDIIVPTGHIHIVYNFADPSYLIDENSQIQIPYKVLMGQFKKAIEIEYSGAIKQVGLAIRPLALHTLFNEVSGLYTGAIIDCSEMPNMKALHKKIEESVQQYSNAPEKMFDVIEDYFQPFTYEEEVGQLYEAMLAYIEANKGLIDVVKMAATFGYSVSSLERNFKKYLGITPKAYGDILRFRYAVLDEDPIRLFYDQSHFIKTCRKYTGKIPADISKSQEISLRHMLQLKDV